MQSLFFDVHFQHSGFNISGCRFENCSIGNKDIKITYKDMFDYVRISLQPGLPSKLKFNAWQENEVSRLESIYKS